MAIRKQQRKAWTTPDVAALKRDAKAGVHARTIGRKLKRTEGAVRQKAHSMNLSLRAAQRVNRKKAKAAG